MYMEILFWIMAVLSIIGMAIITSTKLTSLISKESGYWIWCIANLYFIFYFWMHEFIAVSIMFAVYFLISVKGLVMYRIRNRM